MVKLLKGLKPFTLSIVIIFTFTFIRTITELFLPTLMSDIVDTGIVEQDIGYIAKVGAIMLLIAGLGALCSILTSMLSAKTGSAFARDLRNKVFEKVENYSLKEFDEKGTASLITRTTNDITQVQNLVVMLLRMFIRAPLMAIGGIIMAINKNPNLSLIIIVVVIVLGIIIGLVASKSIPMFKSMQVKIDKLNLVLRERLTGIRVIRAFNKVNHENNRFNDANKDLTNTAIKVNKLMACLTPILMLLFNFTTIFIIWFGSFKINNGAMQVGDLMAFIQYVSQIMFSLIMLTMIFILIPRASASAIRINEVLEVVPEINDPTKPIETGSKRGYVEFQNVSFRYNNAEGRALEDISFNANPGEVTAIIGGTGSGKSTLVNLISRFYDVTKGKILIDGVDIREMSQGYLRKKIGLVPQKAVLFSGTIIDNIKYGKEDASRDEIVKACEIAQATEFINDMKDKYDSVISQGGTNVSGGQKQRLSIARALVRKPEIYLFDDSFSALDFKTDAKLRQALNKEIVDDTIIIVAQRVTTVMNADRIIVLDEGRIVGMGTHKELLSSSDVYKQIVSSQLSEEELA
ncbi:multidrug ABC transporter ATP-binding protein [Vallitalea longa]|uniref:Multidrug ABC transporter ATP-binding protein n=1 Tax=Vallitalea longa TaxID=2936439 RepID=A0A9W6DI82_9FIRM|nr:ABC transporter ATP-binding protein [Vallitalea longa]GKX31639.1 multidrug ABC transporter ATP-binding protein [Vallitalea longa]